MNTESIKTDLWLRVKSLLLPYEGMVSQLYILDLPIGALGDCLDGFCGAVENPILSTLNGFTFDEADRLPYSKELLKTVLLATKEDNHHLITANLTQQRELNLWVWVGEKGTFFDVELVFWADQFFPDPINEFACEKSFLEVLNIVDNIRLGHPLCKCVLSASETGDPRDEGEQSLSLSW